jgi:nucleoside-diphosphate-sugar epimerase
MISINPQNFYSSTKQAFESILKYYTESGFIKNITISLSDTYGPGDNRPKFINLVIEALDKDVVFNMSPGNQEIRYIHVDDVIEAYLVAIDLLFKNKINKSETYSVSGIEPMTLNELVSLVSEVVGKKIPRI